MGVRGGWFGMACWNALSAAQQARLIEWGNLPIGSRPEGGGCQRGASVAIEGPGDPAPGPRFLCLPCAIEYLQGNLGGRFDYSPGMDHTEEVGEGPRAGGKSNGH